MKKLWIPEITNCSECPWLVDTGREVPWCGDKHKEFEYDEELDGRECVDICGFHTACEAFSLDASKVRFDAQCIRDLNDDASCPKGRRQGFITTRRFGDLIGRWKRP